jgi:hypothetical protein
MTRCRECDEWWCCACEGECPTCLVGAGVETGVVVCGRCDLRYCEECRRSYECVECRADLCDECWNGGESLCIRCWGEEPPAEDEAKAGLELPPGFQIWEGEHRDFDRADPKEWRLEWKRTKKPPIWRKGDDDGSR